MPKAKLPAKEFSWTPELAYAVGLLVTDGNLSKDGRHITMRSSDKGLLETFRMCLNRKKDKIAQSHNDGYATKPSFRVQFSDVRFYNWLVSIGVKPAKTYTIGTIKIPYYYFRDFLRGHLDGDGTLYTYRDTYNVYKDKRYSNTRVYMKFISASEAHIQWLHSMIIAHSPVRGVLEIKKPYRERRVLMWGVKFSKYESLALLRWLYYKDNLPALERKRIIALNLLSRVKNGRLIR
ncbi:MAG: hypothetical protein HYT41_02230 [Candidatus Sungbacteria bacterium]|nr:hypothetical protein [Candidatus Sungbacteria bacterium]